MDGSRILEINDTADPWGGTIRSDVPEGSGQVVGTGVHGPNDSEVTTMSTTLSCPSTLHPSLPLNEVYVLGRVTTIELRSNYTSRLSKVLTPKSFVCTSLVLGSGLESSCLWVGVRRFPSSPPTTVPISLTVLRFVPTI